MRCRRRPQRVLDLFPGAVRRVVARSARRRAAHKHGGRGTCLARAAGGGAAEQHDAPLGHAGGRKRRPQRQRQRLRLGGRPVVGVGPPLVVCLGVVAVRARAAKVAAFERDGRARSVRRSLGLGIHELLAGGLHHFRPGGLRGVRKLRHCSLSIVRKPGAGPQLRGKHGVCGVGNSLLQIHLALQFQ